MPESVYPLHKPAILSVQVPSSIPGKPVRILRTASVPSPSKLSPVQYQEGGIPRGSGHAVLMYRSVRAGLSGQTGAVYLVQQTGGFRIREVLALTTANIMAPDTLIIPAFKGSRTRSIRLPELADQFATLIRSGPHPLFRISYSHVYRQYINAGILIYNAPGKRNTVTHVPRREYIQAVHQSTGTLDTTRDVVGHRSRKSTQSYIEGNG